jgi:hypothetical protein
MKTESQEKLFYVYKNSNNKIIAKPTSGNQKNGKGLARSQTIKTGLKEYLLNGTINPDHSSYNIAIKKYLKDNYYLKGSNDTIIYPDEISKELFEGAKQQVVVNIFERDKNARRACLEEYGYSCFVCNFNFEHTFGSIGKNFIHVHHIKPLSEINKEYKVNPTKDLIPVCPNCHAMLHKKTPAYSLEELKAIIKKTHNKNLERNSLP